MLVYLRIHPTKMHQIAPKSERINNFYAKKRHKNLEATILLAETGDFPLYSQYSIWTVDGLR